MNLLRYSLKTLSGGQTCCQNVLKVYWAPHYTHVTWSHVRVWWGPLVGLSNADINLLNVNLDTCCCCCQAWTSLWTEPFGLYSVGAKRFHKVMWEFGARRVLNTSQVFGQASRQVVLIEDRFVLCVYKLCINVPIKNTWRNLQTKGAYMTNNVNVEELLSPLWVADEAVNLCPLGGAHLGTSLLTGHHTNLCHVLHPFLPEGSGVLPGSFFRTYLCVRNIKEMFSTRSVYKQSYRFIFTEMIENRPASQRPCGPQVIQRAAPRYISNRNKVSSVFKPATRATGDVSSEMEETELVQLQPLRCWGEAPDHQHPFPTEKEQKCVFSSFNLWVKTGIRSW